MKYVKKIFKHVFSKKATSSLLLQICSVRPSCFQPCLLPFNVYRLNLGYLGCYGDTWPMVLQFRRKIF